MDRNAPDAKISHPGQPEAFGASHAQSYAHSTGRQVPGLDGLHRMVSLLLAERVPQNGRVLVVGAGGGLELRALADSHSGWTFDGIDPSADMLKVAAQAIHRHNDRVALQQGYIDTAPQGPFDGATCLLTLHFVPREQRLETLRQIHRRLKPGAPLIVAHISFPQTEPECSQWIARHVAFGAAAPDKAEDAKQAIASRLFVLSPQEDEAMLQEAGFYGVCLFYAGLTFRGWVGYA